MLSLNFSQDDLQSLAALLDAAVKATGIEGAKLAMPIVQKIEAAVAEANAAQAKATQEAKSNG